jgi:zinc protease
VRLNVKKTDFEAGQIGLGARVGVGAVTEPPTQRGLRSIAAATFIAGGLGKHSADDLRELLAGRNVGWNFDGDWDAFVFGGSTTRDDLVLQLQMLTAYLTDAGYRLEALRVARKGIQQAYVSFRHTANGPLATDIGNLLASGDPRFGLPPEQELLSRTLDDVKAWLQPHLADGAVELAVVGDLDVEATIAAVAQTLGALTAARAKAGRDGVDESKIPGAAVRERL